MTFSYAKEGNAASYYKILKEVNKIIKQSEQSLADKQKTIQNITLQTKNATEKATNDYNQAQVLKRNGDAIVEQAEEEFNKNNLNKAENLIDDAIETTKNNTGLILNFAFNYGGRDEIVKAAKKYALDYSNGTVSDLDEESFAKYLYTSHLPEVDLLIRTGSEMRVSNFLLWQIAYSEFVVIDTLWPDFNNEILDQCIAEYNSRKRNFGGRDETKSN